MDEVTATRERWEALFGRLDALSDRLAQLNADLDGITECAALMEAGLEVA